MKTPLAITDVLCQLRDKKLMRLIMLDEITKVIRILPHERFIKISYIDDDNQPMGLIDKDKLTEEEIKEATVIQSDGFGEQNPETKEILVRRLMTDEETIQFAGTKETVLINRYQFSSSSRAFYWLTYDVTANKFTFKFNGNYANLEAFLLKQLEDFYLDYIDERAYTETMEENLIAMQWHTQFLEKIGFTKLIDENESYVRTRWNGSKYYWDLLLKYLLLYTITPDIVNDYLSGKAEQLETLMFISGAVDFVAALKKDSPLALEMK